MTMYQGTKVPPHRYLEYTNIDIYTIHIASNDVNPFQQFFHPKENKKASVLEYQVKKVFFDERC
jgi:hypothetical protein